MNSSLAHQMPRSTEGLSTAEARKRLSEHGTNEISEHRRSVWLALLRKLWEPVPWMLEATIILEIVLEKRFEAGIIAVLLVFNALLSLFQEERANKALELLRGRLAVNARVMRDGAWCVIPARELVPGDFVHLRMGDLVPADVRLRDGPLEVDQSVLTGESIAIEANRGAVAYAGATIRRGEASGQVVATGDRTFFGRTAQLVETAKTATHLQGVIFTIVKYMMVLDATLVAVLLGYTLATHMAMSEMLPFLLILMVASVPVALPATFTLATALGAQELAGRGVLATRLSAIEEAAAMDLLCSDKTGTITENRLTLSALRPYPPYTRDQLMRFAAMACDESTQDPIDMAILSAGAAPQSYTAQRLKLIPFDPATKLAEAVLIDDGVEIRAVKGAPRAVAARVGVKAPGLEADVEAMATAGVRVLAVAAGREGDLRLIGLLGLHDPPRADSRQSVQALQRLGVRVMMVTGDGLATARAVAAQVRVGERAVAAAELRAQDGSGLLDYDVLAEVLPEDKFRLIRELQKAGRVVGMTGDGVNDAPALKQAEVGIAVANATDVAKASASLVLTNSGLGDIVAAVETSRRIYQRMLTYTLNKIIKTVEISFFLSIGVILTQDFIITPALIVLLLFTNDFVTMSIATDNVSFSRAPDRWDVRTLMKSGTALGGMTLALSMTLFFGAWHFFHLPLRQLQTMVFVTLVFTGQGTIYLVRERRHFWKSRPSRWLIISSVADLCVVSILAARGILMAPLAPEAIAAILFACVIYLTGLDFLKTRILEHFHYAPKPAQSV